MYQVYEYFPMGNLKKLLAQKTSIPENESLLIFKDIVHGIKALYEKNIIHQNLKPSNVFFRGDIAVIGDFNGCKILKSKYETLNGCNGLPSYMAPEILANQSFDMRSDLYSLGIVLYEMIFGQKPYKSVNAKELLAEMEQSYRIKFENIPISQMTEDLLKGLLHKNPSLRMSHES